MTSEASQTGPPTTNTSLSLLVRAQEHDQEAWKRLVQIYGPLVYRWARRAGVQTADAQDIVQDVFLSVALDLSKFRRVRPQDSFRAWLNTITRHKIMDYFRRTQRQASARGGSTAHNQFQRIAAPESADEEQSEVCRLRHRAIAIYGDQFDRRTWEAFCRTVLRGDRPADVARDLGLSIATVYRVRVRVLTRLQIELDGMV